MRGLLPPCVVGPKERHGSTTAVVDEPLLFSSLTRVGHAAGSWMRKRKKPAAPPSDETSVVPSTLFVKSSRTVIVPVGCVENPANFQIALE